MFHFAFFLKIYKKSINKDEMQDLYDFFFRQLELSIREIGYGDASINKKMKTYINTFHTIIFKVENWENLTSLDKNELIKSFFDISKDMNKLTDYFDKYINFLLNNPFNLFIKSVINIKI